MTIWYSWDDMAPMGLQIARPWPEFLDEERSGSAFGFLDCRLVASQDAIERYEGRKVQYSVTVTQDPGVGGKASRPLFRLAGGGVV